jgi:predicted amidohydrolase YtcJ
LSGRRRSRRRSLPGNPSRTKRKRSNAPSKAGLLQPTRIFLNGNVLTLDPACPAGEAIAVAGDKILSVGTNQDTTTIAGPSTQITDLKGVTVLPGFIDSHIHLIWYGISLGNINLRDVRSIGEMKRLVAERASGSADWIQGNAWDQEKFVERRYPTKHDLDEVCRDTPVSLRRVCGHICVANSAALEKAGITARTADPPGGIIDRDEAGEPTGILRENALELLESAIPRPRVEDLEQAALAASEIALRAGITSVHCITSSPLELRALLNLKAKGKLTVRFYVFIPADQLRGAVELGLRSGLGDEWLRIGGVKIFTDGSLGARTAALEAPYADDPANRGVTTYNQDELDGIVSEAHRADIQVAAHAIGDRAVGMVLRAFEKAMKLYPGKKLRHRIEHASVLNQELVSKMSALGIIAAVQPHFIVSDSWLDQRLGTRRAQFTYAFSSMLRNRIKVVAGSDCPVEPLDPLLGIAAATARPNAAEAANVEQAIAFYTRDAAYGSFEEAIKGTITPGKYADFVILEKDPRKLQSDRIGNLRVLMTVVGGKVAYQSNGRLMS